MRFFDGSERDINWVDDYPVFRIVLFAGPTGVDMTTMEPAGYDTEVLDVYDADFTEVFSLATELAGGSKFFSIALLTENDLQGRGLVWLTGTNLNYSSYDEIEGHKRDIALSRPRSTDEAAEIALQEVLRDLEPGEQD